jgi:hypothetical protein
VETIIVIILWLIKYLRSFSFSTIKSNTWSELKCLQEIFEKQFLLFFFLLVICNKYFPRVYYYWCVTMSYLRLNMRQCKEKFSCYTVILHLNMSVLFKIWIQYLMKSQSTQALLFFLSMHKKNTSYTKKKVYKS